MNWYKQAQGDSVSWEEFLKMIDSVCIRKTGMDRDFYPDYNYSNFFEDGMSREEAIEAADECAYELLENAGADKSLLDRWFGDKEEKEVKKTDEEKTEEFFDKYIG
jgi:hypothetical protein